MANRINIVISADDKASKPIRDVSDEMDRGSGSSSKFGSALASLGGVIAKTTVAAGALAVGAGSAGLAIGMGFNSSVEQAEAKLMAFMKDNEKVAQTLSWVKNEAALTQFSFTEMADAAANLTPVAKQSNMALEDLVQQAEVLAALNPAEGLTGAAFSLREALSGDWVSIVERFNLPRKRINELKEQGVPAMQIISRTLNEMGIDYGLVAKQGQTVAARFDQVKDKLTMMAGAAAKPIFDRVSRELDTLGSFDYSKIGAQLADLTQNILGSFDLLRTGQFQNGMFAGWVQKDAAYIKFLENLRSTAIDVVTYLKPGFEGVASAIGSHLVPAAQAFVSSPFVRIIGTSLVVAVRAASWALEEMIKQVGGFISQMSSSTGILIGITAGLVGYGVVVRTITMATTAWAAAQTLLNNVLKANPLGLLIGVIAGISAAYAAATIQTDRNRTATQQLETARRNFTAATDAAKAAEDRLTGAQLQAEGAALAVERAQLAHNQAVAQYGPTSLEAREAAFALKRAQDDLANSTSSVRDRTREASEAQKALDVAKDVAIKANAASGGSASAAAGQYASLRDRINEAGDAMKKGDVKGNVQALTSVQNFMPKRSIGTNFAPGGSTLVGEHGPEVVNLPAGSRVSPAWKSRSDTASSGSGETTIQINGNVILQTAAAVDAFFKQQDQAQRFARMGMGAPA